MRLPLRAANETVRVKHLHSKLEDDVPVADVARYLAEKLRPHPAGGALRAADEAEGDGEGDAGRERERERRRREKR